MTALATKLVTCCGSSLVSITVSPSCYRVNPFRPKPILPCFLAAQDERLVEVLPEEVDITRQFWMYCREDLRKLKRITLFVGLHPFGH